MSLFQLLTDFFELPEEYQCPDSLTNDYFVRLRLGFYFLLSGILLILLYIPCFIVMLKSKSRNPSFRVMIILAVFDIINLAVNSVSTGIFNILGASFCQYPRLIFIIGAIGNGTWMAGCAMCILLAMDRCVEINSKFFLAFLFHKKAFRVVLAVVGIYWMYSVWFTKPLLFSARYSSWFFDPKVNRDPNIYRNVPHTINNLVVSASTTGLYIYMCVFLLYKKGKSTNSMWMSRNKNQVILQAVIICSFHALAAYIYVYMQFFYSPPLLIILGQLTWQWSNGCFCVVYLTINKSIRSSVKKMLLSYRFPNPQILYVLCLIAMLKRELIRHPAYKVMVCLALFDIPSIFIACIFTGYFGYSGIYFCDYPRLIFVLGSFGFGLWMGCTFSCSALALCRISGVNTNLEISWIFRSPCIYFLIVSIFALPSYGIFFTEPLIFRTEYMSWFFDPGTGLVDSSNYHNISQVINNAAESVITTILYAYLVFYIIRNRTNVILSAHDVRVQRQVILQAAIICFFHSLASIIYTYMQFFYSPAWLLIFAQISWHICTGFVTIVYLTLNPTIRSEVVKLICPKKLQGANQVYHFSDAVRTRS
ncbi:hypothetical protein B9Z55_017587 [Caenorhabditis nigoni]|uniref:Uncharacterized protein n=1 Tax=Caenorhabditis nigoni TaxID=1611254 RepID=A0A2G5TAM8_9PELO|nr:hypothetical protein B9Z55_017587 [Caenorhabditis nigoni]